MRNTVFFSQNSPSREPVSFIQEDYFYHTLSIFKGYFAAFSKIANRISLTFISLLSESHSGLLILIVYSPLRFLFRIMDQSSWVNITFRYLCFSLTSQFSNVVLITILFEISTYFSRSHIVIDLQNAFQFD